MSDLIAPRGRFVLGRAGFGARPGDDQAFADLGESEADQTAAFVDLQLTPDLIDDSDVDGRIEEAEFETIDLSRRQTWIRYVVNEDGEADRSTPIRELRRLTMLRATYSERQATEVLVDFWHNHFNVFGDDDIVRSMIMGYDRDVIRPNALGNFRTMLGAVAESACMLYYLDNYRSTVAGPNENWARELLELHTLGAENYFGAGVLQSDVPTDADGLPMGYVDDDVYEATRAFTGWTVNPDTGALLYERDDHDRFQKQVIGTFIEADQPDLADGIAVLDALAAHPGTAMHVCRKLCRRLVADDPPQELVSSAAEVFYDQRDAVDQLAQVVGHILRSDSFAQSHGLKSRRPFEFAIALLRQMDVDMSFATGDEFTEGFLRVYNQMGQPLFGWVPPDGYPDQADYWNNTNSVLNRWLLANEMLGGRSDDRYILDVAGPTRAAVNTADGIVDFWLQRIFGAPVAEATRDALVDFMAQGFDPTFDLGQGESTVERVRALVSLMLMTPEYQCR